MEFSLKIYFNFKKATMLIIDRREIGLRKYTAPVLLPILLKKNPVSAFWSC